ncbi:HlyD family type I secretion periplasmic adaptor subunit [Ensifer sp. ENS09]|uniref:HlyD family type I secretion periplasmic adaptor subunit n=1 Tax=Ensifer sp. ENS09 TaxID=2769263 RepID=UPI00177E9FCD|nr:HlyD family type I secretion periplasmic adaptor subunit [Ensifer sp. ENS09]MBD9653136.1 HlyD family type I secretion periplasmic adaptor subunit [Ensifer sp. ENS09]
MTSREWGAPASPTIRITVWLFVVFFAVAVIGSYVAETEIVARGQGKVVPTSRVQTVQPRGDGKITAIHVAEGGVVKRGQPLVVLDDTSVKGDIDRVKGEIDRHTMDRAVAQSILLPLDKGDPAGQGLVEGGLVVLRQESATEAVDTEALTIAVLSALGDQIAQIDAQAFRIEKMKGVQVARIEKARTEAHILALRFAASESLKERGTISNSDYLERMRLINAGRNEVLIAERELSGLEAEAQTVIAQRKSAISEVRSTYQKQFSAASIALKALQGELSAAERRLADLSIEAPIAGRVENLAVHTVGGFVEAGAALMTVVPSDGKIELEAFFDNRDIGFLKEGQRAFVKFDAFPPERFGVVHGVVTSVGADARQQVAGGPWIYAARIRLEQNGISVGNRMASFSPGMTATVDVITGERRLISYFFEPILKTLQDSFGER